MIAVRIGHDGEWFVMRHKLVDELLGALVVHIVVAGAVDDEQVSLQPLGMRDGRAVHLALGVVLRQAHVALLIDAVIKPTVRHGSHSHGSAVEIRIAEDGVTAAAASTTSSNFRDSLSGLCLLGRFNQDRRW